MRPQRIAMTVDRSTLARIEPKTIETTPAPPCSPTKSAYLQNIIRKKEFPVKNKDNEKQQVRLLYGVSTDIPLKIVISPLQLKQNVAVRILTTAGKWNIS
ncbi:hypothetical protein ILYODFUR_010612 [Ilyodon furcidens]|uniref:Uncharacterized protein n=1 Tax=Ilyodon furcidens TaxID=33524 RepID=A0ABV0VEG2_9TELE